MEITKKRAIELIDNEIQCITNKNCKCKHTECADCDLVVDTDEIISAFELAKEVLSNSEVNSQIELIRVKNELNRVKSELNTNSDCISRRLAMSHPFANNHYDHDNASLEFIMGFESYKEWLGTLPPIRESSWKACLDAIAQLPRDGNYYLVKNKDGDMSVYHYDTDKQSFSFQSIDNKKGINPCDLEDVLEYNIMPISKPESKLICEYSVEEYLKRKNKEREI